MSGEQEGGRLIERGARATALGFAARLAARLVFLFVAGRLFGAGAFGAFALALAAVELAVAVGSLGTKKTLFQLLDRHAGMAGRPLPHLLLDSALLVAAASLLLGTGIAAAALATPASLLGPAVATAGPSREVGTASAAAAIAAPSARLTAATSRAASSNTWASGRPESPRCRSSS